MPKVQLHLRSFVAFFVVFMMALGAFLAVGTPARAAESVAPWAGSGPGTATTSSDGTATLPQFQYSINNFGSATQTWTFSTTTSAPATIDENYDYSGFHAYFEVTAFLTGFVTHNGTTTSTSLVDAGPTDCCSAPSAGFHYTGVAHFVVQPGDTYGFTMGGTNGDSTNVLQGTLSLARAQSITFPAPAGTTLGATSSSGLPITYSISTPAVCTITGSSLHLLSIGSCTLTASQPGDNVYQPATDVVRTIHVVKATPGLTAHASAGTSVSGRISDTAVLSNLIAPTGNVTFRLFAPNDAACTAAPIFTSAVAVTDNGSYASQSFVARGAGTYRWIASYSGDASNATGSTACTATVQAVSVAATAAAPISAPTLPDTGANDIPAVIATGLLLLTAGAGALTVATRRR